MNDSANLPTSMISDDGAEMVLVSAGQFIWGITDDDLEELVGKSSAKTFRREYDEEQQSSITLPSFYIDKFPVTNKQYRTFLSKTGYKRRPRLIDSKIWGGDAQPVVGVTWPDALAYTSWCGKRLPSEQEWEKAARGTDGRLFPWGNTLRASLCNCAETGLECTSEVGSFTGCKSSYGAYDMAGNVWEMTTGQWDATFFAMRGGSFLTYVSFCRTTARWAPSEDELAKGPKWLGFRCVRQA